MYVQTILWHSIINLLSLALVVLPPLLKRVVVLPPLLKRVEGARILALVDLFTDCVLNQNLDLARSSTLTLP